MATGFTVLPNVLIARQSDLGLNPIDMCIILHLSMYWWEVARKPFPSKGRIAAEIGLCPDTVRRHIKALEDRGLITRKARYDPYWGRLSNIYDLSGLIDAAKPYAQEMLAEQGREV